MAPVLAQALKLNKIQASNKFVICNLSFFICIFHKLLKFESLVMSLEF